MLDYGFMNEGVTDSHTQTAVKIYPEDRTLNYQTQLEEARTRLKAFDPGIQELVRQSKAVEVVDTATAKQATETTALVATMIKRIEKERVNIVDEPGRYVRSVNSFVKSYRDDLDGVTRELKRKLGDFAYNQELERRKEEKRLQEEAAWKQKELDKAADAAKVERVELPQQVLPQKQAPVRSDAGTASTRMVWTHDVVSENAVPREYLMVNDKAIKAAVNAGIRKIAGVRIYEKPVVSVRAA